MKNRTGLLVALLSLALVVTNTSAIALIYQGLTNTSLGSATLSVASNQLTVDNLGTNGQDGVNIALNPGNNFDGGWLPLDPSDALPVGAYVQSQSIGTAGSITNGPLGSTTVTKAGTSNYVITADFSPLGSSTRTVQVWNGPNLVGQVTGQTGSVVATSLDCPDTWSLREVVPPDWDWNDPTSITISDGPTVTGTKILITPEGGTPVSSVSAGQILAAYIPSITITNESVSLIYQGLTNTSLGSATLIVVSNQLTVGNLGTNGQDGVDIALNPGNNIEVHWQDLDPSDALPVGASVQNQIIGTAGSITNGLLGSTTVTKAGTSNYVITADFSPLGSSTRTVQVWNGPNLVAQVNGQTGSVCATSVDFPPKSTDDMQPPPTFPDWDWNNPTSITISGGPTVMGTKILLIPEGGTPVSSVSAVRILAAYIPSITITQEVVSLVYQGLTNTSLGSATLSVASNQLTVGNLGTNGQDGVSIALTVGNLGTNGQDGVSFAAEWLDLDPSNALPVGASVQSQSIGTAGSITNGLLGSTTVTKAGTSDYVITADFSPLGSSTRTVQVWNGPNLVAQVTGQSGPVVATSVDFPPKLTGDIRPPLCFPNWDWPSAVSITISGGPTVMGTKILIIPEGAAPVSSVSAEQILAAYIPSITFTNETVSFGSLLKITSIAHSGNNIVLTWTTEGISNIVQVTTNATGNYNPNNFVDLANIVITTLTTNYVDVGGATNKPARYYRIREPLQ